MRKKRAASIGRADGRSLRRSCLCFEVPPFSDAIGGTVFSLLVTFLLFLIRFDTSIGRLEKLGSVVICIERSRTAS